ncbi:hypothetical protein F5887DRAFT_650716 [Amanita rubescens]|nr:hypothetical protein F5887DRAFT_650716 [Amanita rubescens]
MGESQWFRPTVRNRLGRAIVLANFYIEYGKFYDIHHPYNETMSAQGTKIEGKGSFEVHLEGSGEMIAKIYWDCPYIGDNKLEKRYVMGGYDVSFNGFNIPSGPLGGGTINVRED